MRLIHMFEITQIILIHFLIILQNWTFMIVKCFYFNNSKCKHSNQILENGVLLVTTHYPNTISQMQNLNKLDVKQGPTIVQQNKGIITHGIPHSTLGWMTIYLTMMVRHFTQKHLNKRGQGTCI